MNIIYECVDRCEVRIRGTFLKRSWGNVIRDQGGWGMGQEGGGWDLHCQVILA